MTTSIAWYEWRLLWRDPVVWVTLAVLAACVLGAWVVGRDSLRVQQTVVASLRDEQAQRLAELQTQIDQERARLVKEGRPLTPATFGFRHGTYVGHYGGYRWMIQPPLATAPLAIGESDLQPAGYLASVDRQQGNDRHEFTNPFWLRVARFDLFFVAGYLFPLMLVLLCAAAVSGEKERQTLPLRLVQGTRLWTLALGRLALRGGVAIALMLALTTLLAWRAGMLAEGPPYVGIARLLLWQAGFLAYALFWLALMAWVDAGGRSVAANLLIATGLWIVILLVLPGLVNAFADARYPLESRAAFERELRESYQRTWALDQEDVLRTFYAAHPEIPTGRDEPKSLERFMIYQMRTHELMDARLQPLQRSLDARAMAHRDFVQAARFGSPLFLLHHVLTTAAGTDMARIEDFWRQRDAFLDVWQAFYVARIYQRVPTDDLRESPGFDYREPTLGSRLPSLLATLAGLLLPAACALALAWRGYRRFPITS